MKWIREHISKMPSFNYLNDHLSTIESMIETNPDLCIEVCKSMIESLCKTILTDQAVAYNTDWQFQTLVKLTLENMFTDELHKTDKIELIRRIASVVQKLGEMRNSSGFASHGQDKQHTPFDKTTSLLTYKTTDVIGGFILNVYTSSNRPNSRIHYEDCQSFNELFDEENPLELGGVILSASEALYKQDYEAYKEVYYSYLNNLKN